MGNAQVVALLLLRVVIGITMIAHGTNHWKGGGRIAGTARWFTGLGLRYGTLQAWMSVVTEIGAGACAVIRRLRGRTAGRSRRFLHFCSRPGCRPYAEFVAAASFHYSGTKYYTNPADPAREDDGLFGPESVTWRVMNHRIMWVAGFRSLYLQGLHPRVMRATWQNGSFTDPREAWGRLFRTMMFVQTLTFGTTAEAERAGRRVRRIHESVTATEPDGTVYRIDEPELLLWVHCGEVASIVDVARRSRLPFCAAELDTFVDEQRRSAQLVGLDPAAVPASVTELDAYYEQIRPSLYACDEAMQALWLTFHPPLPEGNRAMKLALPRFNAFAFSTLPRWARQMYGRPGGPLTDVIATADLRATRLAARCDPVFRAAMRAVHRAEGGR